MGKSTGILGHWEIVELGFGWSYSVTLSLNPTCRIQMVVVDRVIHCFNLMARYVRIPNATPWPFCRVQLQGASQSFVLCLFEHYPRDLICFPNSMRATVKATVTFGTKAVPTKVSFESFSGTRGHTSRCFGDDQVTINSLWVRELCNLRAGETLIIHVEKRLDEYRRTPSHRS